MALPPDSRLRDVAAAIPQPAAEEDVRNQLETYLNGVYGHNDELPRILFRNPDNDQDVTEAVYRWDNRQPEEIFQTGFPARPQTSTQTSADYFNLTLHVNHGGIPADISPVRNSVFVSTSRRQDLWTPRGIVDTDMPDALIYRYQIYAPGGIDAVLTLREQNGFRNQQEISFVGGIRPQYIRMARQYVVRLLDSGFPRFIPMDTFYFNARFNPNPGLDGRTTPEFMQSLRHPLCPSRRVHELIIVGHAEHAELKRDVEGSNYVDPVRSVGHYIESAFNFSGSTEAYLFIGDQCLLINYAPGTTDDKILKGPLTIGDAFPCLKDTIFASGIDAAFTASSKNEAYIFRSNIYALIKFTRDGGSIIQGPKMITDSFYSLKNTIFEKGIDAAFTSSRTKNEAYIFKGDQYALINFAPGTTDDYIIQGPKKITESFPSLKGTLFQDGFDAAFSSTAKNEAYIFKGDTYALINYAPGTTDYYIINGPITPISDGFHSLKDIIPMYPCDC